MAVGLPETRCEAHVGIPRLTARGEGGRGSARRRDGAGRVPALRRVPAAGGFPGRSPAPGRGAVLRFRDGRCARRAGVGRSGGERARRRGDPAGLHTGGPTSPSRPRAGRLLRQRSSQTGGLVMRAQGPSRPASRRPHRMAPSDESLAMVGVAVRRRGVASTGRWWVEVSRETDRQGTTLGPGWLSGCGASGRGVARPIGCGRARGRGAGRSGHQGGREPA